MANWPATLPQYPTISGDTREEAKTVKSNRMLSGPVRMRRVSSNPSRPWSCSVVVTDAQLATFQTFFRTTTKAGSESFVWFFPDSSSTNRNFYFDPDSPPRYKPLGAGKWLLELELIFASDA